MSAEVISRQRVIDHGEVLTPPGLVNDMLDLPGIAEECKRIDARFLEPACGDGNFLAEVLRRRLEKVNELPKRDLLSWERDSLRGLANLYGIELLNDNVQDCRDRLLELYESAYTARFGDRARSAVIAAARCIARCNIVQGDALAMTTVGDSVYTARPLVLTEWSMVSGGRFKRRLFEYEDLTPPDEEQRDAEGLFKPDAPTVTNEDGAPAFRPRPVGDLPLTHYLKLAESIEAGEPAS